MKTSFILLTLILSAGAGTWYFQDNLPEPCIEDWAKQTQSLFTGASAYFFTPEGQDKVDRKDILDQRLQELLPTDNMDLKYHPTPKAITTTTAALDKSHRGLLPNLFNKTKSDGTSLSGKVHMDEDDNIIGAEVEVAIPTNL